MEEGDEEGESDSGWLEEEDDIILEDGIIRGSLTSRGTWELESIGGETDSGHYISSYSDHLSPLYEKTRLSACSMIPDRVQYPGEREGGISPGLTPSLFPNLPPTIHFPLPKENCKSIIAYFSILILSVTNQLLLLLLIIHVDQGLSSKDKSLLKWKPSTITPNVIKHILNKVGFTYTSSK